MAFAFLMVPAAFGMHGDPKGAGSASPREDWGVLGARERTAEDRPAPVSDAGWPMARGALALAAVLGVLGGGVWLLRRVSPGSGATPGVRNLEVVGRAPVGPKHAVVLVRVAGRVLVLGVSGDRIQPLAELQSQDEVERFPAAGSMPAGGRFQQMLSDVAARFRGNPPGGFPSEPEAAAGARREIDELKKKLAHFS